MYSAIGKVGNSRTVKGLGKMNYRHELLFPGIECHRSQTYITIDVLPWFCSYFHHHPVIAVIPLPLM
jgi:hypothetical protein